MPRGHRGAGNWLTPAPRACFNATSMNPGRTALVTGATGFIGSHLAEHLLARDWTVRALVRRGRPGGFLPAGVRTAEGDLRDPLSLPAVVRGADAVFHVAGALYSHRPRDFHEVNALGTESLLAACRKECPELRRFVLVSSLAAAGPSRAGRPVRETDAPRPVSDYGRSKLAAERRAAASGLPVTVVRPPIVYGPRDRGVLPVADLLARGWRPALLRSKLYSLCYVEDLVRGIRSAAESPSSVGRTYHLAESRHYSLDYLLRLILRLLGVRRARPVPAPEPLLRLAGAALDPLARGLGLDTTPAADKVREIAWDEWTADSGRARAELGFAARIGPEEGFSRTLRFYRRRGWIPVGGGAV